MDPLPEAVVRSTYAFAGDFSSLLPLGVLTLHSLTGLPSPAPPAPDNWHWAPPLPWVSSRRGTLESELEFLSTHDFMRATYFPLGGGRATLRVYLCPEDCAWYVFREEAVEYRGRRILKRLWGIVDVSEAAWRGEIGAGRRTAELCSEEEVSLNLSALFNSLEVPKPHQEIVSQASPETQEIFEAVMEDEGIPGLKSELYYYQRESVWKMLQREVLPQKLPDPRLRKWIGPTGLQAWINFDDMTFFRRQTYVNDIRGGILCEEMGTGKTVLDVSMHADVVHLSGINFADDTSTRDSAWGG
jgi:hypothetical protein